MSPRKAAATTATRSAAHATASSATVVHEPAPAERPVRPSAARRSWWLREALAAEAATAPELVAASAAPPLRGTTTADVVVVGGGYTGLWAAYRLTELEPGARIVLLEAGPVRLGPVGAQRRVRHELVGRVPDPRRAVRRHGRDRGRRGDGGRRRRARGVVRDTRRRRLVPQGRIRLGECGPGPGRGWDAAVAACDAVGSRRPVRAADRRRGRGAGPVAGPARRRVPARRRDRSSRRGSPAACAASCWSAGSSSTRARRRSRSTANGRARWAASARAAAAPPNGGREPAAACGRSGCGRRSAAGDGQVLAGSAVLGLNAWAAAWPWFGRRLVTWSSYIVLTEPIPDRLADLGWTGGEGLADGRFTLHYLRTTPDGRIAIGGGGGRAGYGGSHRRGLHRRRAVRRAARLADCGACSRRWPTSGSTTPGAVPSTSPPTTCRGSGGSAIGRSIAGHGYSGNGVAPSLVGGRILAALALDRRDDPALELPMADGSPPRAFPPEPARYLGARVIREAMVRRETAEERGTGVGFATRELSRLPRRLGYHLGLE